MHSVVYHQCILTRRIFMFLFEFILEEQDLKGTASVCDAHTHFFKYLVDAVETLLNDMSNMVVFGPFALITYPGLYFVH